jgi:hypothetical protein
MYINTVANAFRRARQVGWLELALPPGPGFATTPRQAARTVVPSRPSWWALWFVNVACPPTPTGFGTKVVISPLPTVDTTVAGDTTTPLVSRHEERFRLLLLLITLTVMANAKAHNQIARWHVQPTDHRATMRVGDGGFRMGRCIPHDRPRPGLVQELHLPLLLLQLLGEFQQGLHRGDLLPQILNVGQPLPHLVGTVAAAGKSPIRASSAAEERTGYGL